MNTAGRVTDGGTVKLRKTFISGTGGSLCLEFRRCFRGRTIFAAGVLLGESSFKTGKFLKLRWKEIYRLNLLMGRSRRWDGGELS